MRKLIKWFHNFKPPLVLSCVLTVFFGAGSLLSATTKLDNQISPIIVYALYVGAAISLSLSIWAIVLFFQKASPKQQFLDATGNNKFTARLMQDFSYRTMMITTGSLILNVLLTLTKMFTGWYYASTWLMVLSGYYIILCLSKFLLLRYGRKQSRLNDKNTVMLHEWKAYRFCGVMLLVLTFFCRAWSF